MIAIDANILLYAYDRSRSRVCARDGRPPVGRLDHWSPGVEAERAAMLAVLREPSDGSPLADRKWTPRYAARRIAWHVLTMSYFSPNRAACR